MDFSQISIVVVLYKKSLEESETLHTLLKILDTKNNLLVFDNSPYRQYKNDCFEFHNFSVQYFHDPTNPGLSDAYNKALRIANTIKTKWLLLLDQDTTLTDEYINEIIGLDSASFDDNCVAIMPHVLSLNKKHIIAPRKLGLGMMTKEIVVKNRVVSTQITGINSGTLLRIEYLNKINGFSTSYSLDMLDHWYFRKIFQDSYCVFVLNTAIYQDLSVQGDYEKAISFSRYIQILKAENVFMKEENILSFIFYKIKLIFRSMKQMRFDNKKYFQATLKQIFKIN